MRTLHSIITLITCLPLLLQAQTATPVRVLTNQVGYEDTKAKRAVILAASPLTIPSFDLIEQATNRTVYQGKPVFSGPVDKWKHWLFWTLDFSAYTAPGTYHLRVSLGDDTASSHPFTIGNNVLEKATLSDVIYYFKGQRSAGALDKADHHLPLPAALQGPDGGVTDTLDLHGGWYDATGDYGKHLSHLSFSSFFNPQQISGTVWSLLKTEELLATRTGTDYRQFLRRLQDEATYGADYLVRVKARQGSFYRSVGAPGAGKLAQDRDVSPEQQSYRIKENKDQSFGGIAIPKDWHSYESSYRSGAGMAIASLAMASMTGIAGDFSTADYLRTAEDAFAFLEKENASLTNDGKENIVDDYCALSAATELYKATRNDKYRTAAERRAKLLLTRLVSWEKHTDYWSADKSGRPFFHPADAGLPVVSLLYYYPYASSGTQAGIKAIVHRSLEHELSITHEVANPFGYSRQLVQDTLDHRRSSFFFPHGSEASPWWQGENARLSSMAASARLALPLFADDRPFSDSLETFALDQLNWILGLNPFDACMLQGTGHNNPAYAFFGTFEYTNAPGGIVNGITSGLEDEKDIDFNLSYATTRKDYDWRWAEQWLPHASWYLLAIAAGQPLARLATTIDAEHINDRNTLAIGAPAPGFSLPGVDGNTYTLQSFKEAKVLVVVFMSNHCPTSQAYEQRLIRLTREYAAKGVSVVAISPSNPSAVRLDELGYSDVGDTYDDMKIRARQAGFNFPYLYDGDTEIASKQYGPVATPHVFIFDQQRRLRYNGRIDDMENPKKKPNSLDAINAIDALLANREVPVTVTKTFGCSIKWIEKSNWVQKAAVIWANEPVSLDTLDVAGIKRLTKNNGKKLRLINVWATWCIPCVQEFSDLVTLNRMYRDRGFELVTISTDDKTAREKVGQFLQKKQSSSPNYIFTGDDKYKMIEAIDPTWKGALPYTMLVEPGGKVVYAHEGAVNSEELKKIIFNDPMIGRIYK